MRATTTTLLILCVSCGGESGQTDTTTVGTDGTTSASATAGTGSTTGPGTQTSSTSGTTSSTGSSTGSAESTGTTGGVVGTPYVYVGGSTGVSIYTLDLETGAMTQAGAVFDAGTNPNFLAVSADRAFLFAVNGVNMFDGMSTGAVASFAIDPSDGSLSFLSRQASAGLGPAHVSVDRTGGFIFVSNYSGETLSVLPVDDDGMLGVAVDVQDHGNGAHPHQSLISANNGFLLAPDLGRDEVMQYVFDDQTGQLSQNAPPGAASAGGAGPRHLAFSPDEKFVYVVNEYADSVTTFAYDDALGVLTSMETVSTLPNGFDGSQNTCADIHVHPSGQYVYASNRGHDSIATFAVDPQTGALTPLGHESTGGMTPRNFEVDRGGELMLVANQGSDNVVAFAIGAATGAPSPTGESVSVVGPAFVGIVYLEAP